ncbi:SDR family NAD(P)-dependent oxidoreductase [Myxococcota bacterium]|nr:SDR family NAD(P)-dependent oxidoreductase [Myxococcota bacterium]
MGKLDGQIAVITGATRGVGRGCALELAAEGSTVYVTGRTLHEGDSQFPGSLESTVEEISRAGGRAIPVELDQRDDDAVAALFQRVRSERGRLDVLVNSSFLIPDDMDPNAPFWETSLDCWDDMHEVGARSAYVTIHFAAPMLVEQGRGLVANVSSSAGRFYYLHPAYTTAKSVIERLTRDIAHLLEGKGISVVSIWPYTVNSERMLMLDANAWQLDFEGAESPHFTGRAITALAADENVAMRSGRAFTTRQLALDYGFRDLDGSLPYGTPPPLDLQESPNPPPPITDSDSIPE